MTPSKQQINTEDNNGATSSVFLPHPLLTETQQQFNKRVEEALIRIALVCSKSEGEYSLLMMDIHKILHPDEK